MSEKSTFYIHRPKWNQYQPCYFDFSNPLPGEALLVCRFSPISRSNPTAAAWGSRCPIRGHQPVKRNDVFLFNGSHPTRPIAIRRFSDHPIKAH
jgi:hypothetical protein